METFAECIRALSDHVSITNYALVFVAPRQDVSWFSAHHDYRKTYEHQSQLISQQIHNKMTYQVMIIGDKNPILPQTKIISFVPLAWWCGSKRIINYCESTNKSLFYHISVFQIGSCTTS